MTTMMFMMATVFSMKISQRIMVLMMLVLFVMISTMTAMMMMARGSSRRCTLHRRFDNTQFASFNNHLFRFLYDCLMMMSAMMMMMMIRIMIVRCSTTLTFSWYG